MNRLSQNHRVAGVAVDTANREKDDFYPTPPGAVLRLLQSVEFHGPIWECACGDGAISRVLNDGGHEVISTDLVDRGYGESRIDFLMEWEPRAPNIVTNPPFKLGIEFAIKALELTTAKVALLCRLQFLEGQKRRVLFNKTPLACVLVFSKRLQMWRNGEARADGGTGMLPFAWFVWDHEHKGPPTLGWL